MKALLLYNIKAGKGSIERRVRQLCDIFREQNIDIAAREVVFGENPFDGYEDTELAVICGGDGTINYVVNMMRRKAINPTLGIIPSGTANDFAGAVGMSSNPYKAARQIARGSERKVDCGNINGEYFINVFSFGVLTTTSQQTSDRAKHRFGKLAYIGIGLKDLFTMHRMALHVKTHDEEFDCSALMFLAFNGETAGRFPLARKAKIDDGVFDILILCRRNFFVTCWNMLRYLCGSKPRDVRYIKSSFVEITSDRSERTDVDGQRGPDFPIVIRCEAGALTVRC